MQIGTYSIRSDVEHSIRSQARWPSTFAQACRIFGVAVGSPGCHGTYCPLAADYLATVASLSHTFGRTAKKVKQEIRYQRRRHFREARARQRAIDFEIMMRQRA